MEAEQLACQGLADGQTRDADQHRNRPSMSLKGPVKVPQKQQCGPTPHPQVLELVFENDSRCSPEPRSSDAFSEWSDCGHNTQSLPSGVARGGGG